MACNENVVKNISNEVTRNCQTHNVTVETEFVVYLIDLLLLNPKYGKLFTKSINRNNLQFFVEKCVSIIRRGGTSLSTLKMQFIMQTNYDKLEDLIEKHLASIDEDPAPEDEAEMKKLFRKISIYIILASGLGNPGLIVTLKEGMAALESVFSLEDLKVFLALFRPEKMAQLNELLEVASGACLTSLSNSLLTVMQRVNTLSTAVEDSIVVQDETGNVMLDPRNPTLTYEVLTRKLLCDVESMVSNGSLQVDKFKEALEEIHTAVKYKAAVPVVTVFPLFSKLWQIWRSMQNVMYLVSRASRLFVALGAILEHVGVPRDLLAAALQGRKVQTDQYLGFCAVCLCAGALIPSNTKIGIVKSDGRRYAFCSVRMAVRFSKDPQRRLIPSNTKIGVVKSDGRRYAFCSVRMADVQTLTHPIEEYIEKNYSWDLWEWKRRACQWIHCQTHQPMDKAQQTKVDCGVSTDPNNVFLWGLRGQLGYGQHAMQLGHTFTEKKKGIHQLY
ncbi:Uncharacterized protein OBRU01_04830 [Operophtera brumata]|uniref:Cilia- and flagella-associated protein 206 n=1 Tax=Operophtera brumata TaxID=104452 RepID=A0A0L7LN63_OPEBR|nr:Uncharacterized protein OBRU01_04830 [Operophtera brumata]